MPTDRLRCEPFEPNLGVAVFPFSLVTLPLLRTDGANSKSPEQKV
jgi:hypothetical protein